MTIGGSSGIASQTTWANLSGLTDNGAYYYTIEHELPSIIGHNKGWPFTKCITNHNLKLAGHLITNKRMYT